MAADEEDTKRLRSLSEREYEALACFAHGLSCTAIAAHLGIAIKTVTNYRARLVDKLHLTNTTVLLRYAMAHQADMPLPVSVQSTPLPVLAPAVVSPMSPAPMSIAYRPHSVEREEWPG